jgi:putative lipase involved disintegration of autophagic bodies
VVSFRGSRSATNIAYAFTAAFRPSVSTDLCSGCMVAEPFSIVYQSVRANIVAKVQATLADNPGFQLVTTGHSLGGALSHLAGLELRNLGLTVDLVSD